MRKALPPRHTMFETERRILSSANEEERQLVLDSIKFGDLPKYELLSLAIYLIENENSSTLARLFQEGHEQLALEGFVTPLNYALRFRNSPEQRNPQIVNMVLTEIEKAIKAKDELFSANELLGFCARSITDIIGIKQDSIATRILGLFNPEQKLFIANYNPALLIHVAEMPNPLFLSRALGLFPTQESRAEAIGRDNFFAFRAALKRRNCATVNKLLEAAETGQKQAMKDLAFGSIRESDQIWQIVQLQQSVMRLDDADCEKSKESFAIQVMKEVYKLALRNMNEENGERLLSAKQVETAEDAARMAGDYIFTNYKKIGEIRKSARLIIKGDVDRTVIKTNPESEGSEGLSIRDMPLEVFERILGNELPPFQNRNLAGHDEKDVANANGAVLQILEKRKSTTRSICFELMREAAPPETSAATPEAKTLVADREFLRPIGG